MTSQIFKVVFEDPALLVIEKLRPFLSQRADAGDSEGLYEFIGRARGETLYPVHRLDREVLGLMIFGRTPQSAESLSNQFRNREVSKLYEAKVKGRVHKDRDNLVHWLKKNSKTNHVTVFPRETEGAKRAELEYFVLDREESSTRLLIHLKTGRSHQIRVQLFKIGHPILGDTRYNSSARESETPLSIQLRAVYLSVLHPNTGEKKSWSLLDQEEIRKIPFED